MSESMEIEVWSGDWGLPSIDSSCLQIMVYCKFSGVPYTAKVKDSPFRRKLPSIIDGKSTYHNLHEVAAYLKNKNFNSDHFLSPRNLSDVQAYSGLLKDKLYPALQFIWWIDSKNYVQLTRPWYAKKLSFPFNFYYIGHYEAQAKELITCLYGSLENDYAAVETEVYRDAEKCLTLLSNRLGDSKYFFGTQPSSLDAIVFSYLAPLLKAPFPNPTLQNHLKACTNLAQFVENILEKYYSSLIKDYEIKRREYERSQMDEKLNKAKYQILPFFVAFAAMFGYIKFAPAFMREEISIEYLFDEAEEKL